jgi:hypothetical protein
MSDPPKNAGAQEALISMAIETYTPTPPLCRSVGEPSRNVGEQRSKSPAGTTVKYAEQLSSEAVMLDRVAGIRAGIGTPPPSA